ncbi:MAG: DNA mismatch repair endonuclease MutL [Deltaproteobacteria bacterium]|nr:DNA mismatch repair endonuclease MutL [Deltaproteobacteria bacterium]
MARIHLLEDDIINKIAAGEVVERPASVLKELLENSIDAGSGDIHIELEEGGCKRITVRDHGCGIPPQDMELSLKRHATSKIRAADDLFQIKSMGFRGEALASIASVSRFRISSRLADPQITEGCLLRCDGGGPPELSPWNGAPGTTVTVEDLFYNVPARARFLKSATSEYSHCFELVQALALSHPEVSISLSHNGREKLRAPSIQETPHPEQDGELKGESVLRKRLEGVWGTEQAQNLIYIREDDAWGKFEALISPPGVERATAKHMMMFVNQRWVRDPVLRFGLLRGYHSHLLKGRYPQVLGFYYCDPSLVDVNVHPRKTELRFQYAAEVQSLIARAIRAAIRKADWAGRLPESRPEEPKQTFSPDSSSSCGKGQESEESSVYSAYPDKKQTSKADESSPRYTQKTPPMAAVSHSRRQNPAPEFMEASATSTTAPSCYEREPLKSTLTIPADSDQFREKKQLFPADNRSDLNSAHDPDRTDTKRYGATAAVKHNDAPVPWDELVYRGQLFRCYLIFEASRDSLLVLDQHAFHERIQYEKLVHDPGILKTRQRLMIPEILELSASQAECFRERETLIRNSGFDFEWISELCPEIRSVPAILTGCQLDRVFAKLTSETDHSGNGQETIRQLGHQILSTIACHSAIRAGDELSDHDLKDLLGQAKNVDFYHNCPHGRRVFRWFQKRDVEGWFDRL